MEDKKNGLDFQFSASQLKELIKSVYETMTPPKIEDLEPPKKKTKRQKVVKDREYNAKEPSFVLKFTNPAEARLINKFRSEAINKNESPNKMLKSLILDMLSSTNVLHSYTILKNDIYYALRKGIYTSLSPFYLLLEENNIELEHKFDLLNFKLNVILNLLLEKMQKSQFSIEENKLEDLVLFKAIKEQQEQEYILLKKKNQARKIEIKKSYENFLRAEQIEQIINDELKLTNSSPNAKRKLKSIIEYLNQENQSQANNNNNSNQEVKNETGKD